MRLHSPSRLCVGAAVVLLAVAWPAFAGGFGFQPPPRQQARQAARQAQNSGVRPIQGPAARPMQNGVRPGQNGTARPGLQRWMQEHRNLPPGEQLRQLQSEPSFRALPPETQRGVLNEMRRLQGMNPQQLDRRQALLQMTPLQRQQFTASVQQYAGLPPERKQLVRRAFANLRRVPPGQRQAAMNSYPLVQQLSPYEQQVLGNLLVWEPYFAGGPAGGP
jgi:hypothetical protein